jgi:hypothetical protein
VAAGSATGVAVWAGIGSSLPVHLSRTAEILSITPVVLLLALLLAGLTVVIVDTARIHRADTAVQASAKSLVAHYPLYAHAHSYPPRHRGSWVFAIIMLTAMTGITAYFLPAEVNSWAYVVGAENQDTFHPVDYRDSCTGVPRGGGCQVVTDGYLASSGTDVTWGSQVPLAQPFSVRDPVWAWGTGRSLIGGYGSAIASIAGGLFFNAVALLLLYVLVVLMRHTSSRRGRRAPASRPHPAAGPHPGGARRPQSPGRGGQGGGARRPPRAGQEASRLTSPAAQGAPVARPAAGEPGADDRPGGRRRDRCGRPGQRRAG